MRIAVIQHLLRETRGDDADAVAAAVGRSLDRGAELVVLPAFPEGRGATALGEVARQVADATVVLELTGRTGADAAAVIPGAESIGPVFAASGDACFDRGLWTRALAQPVQVTALSPLSENELQAEAALEAAIALSDALSGLVIVAECVGAELGEPGHGGSAIVLLGDVVAEAVGDEDVLIADIDVPVPQPEPREPLPQLATILSQRVAHHEGRRPDVDYPAELSEGPRRS